MLLCHLMESTFRSSVAQVQKSPPTPGGPERLLAPFRREQGGAADSVFRTTFPELAVTTCSQPAWQS